MLMINLNDVVFKDKNIGCYDCNELAAVVIEIKEFDIYLCKDCLGKLKGLDNKK
jgi:hypothetical protein